MRDGVVGAADDDQRDRDDRRRRKRRIVSDQGLPDRRAVRAPAPLWAASDREAFETKRLVLYCEWSSSTESDRSD
jgi:hypothetical protein